MFKILLVDDDADVRRYVKKVLERDNYHVVVVDNGLSALNELNNDTYDLLLSDANMPQYSGFDLIRTIRLQAKHTDLIIAMLTGRREKQDIQQAIELGVKDYIIKPIDYYASKGVCAGKDYDDASWKALLEEKVLEDFIIQKYCPLALVDNLYEDETGHIVHKTFSTITGLFTYNEKLSGIYVRAGLKAIISGLHDGYTMSTLIYKEK